jgi:hypothetical protein
MRSRYIDVSSIEWAYPFLETLRPIYRSRYIDTADISIERVRVAIACAFSSMHEKNATHIETEEHWHIYMYIYICLVERRLAESAQVVLKHLAAFDFMQTRWSHDEARVAATECFLRSIFYRPRKAAVVMNQDLVSQLEQFNAQFNQNLKAKAVSGQTHHATANRNGKSSSSSSSCFSSRIIPTIMPGAPVQKKRTLKVILNALLQTYSRNRRLEMDLEEVQTQTKITG